MELSINQQIAIDTLKACFSDKIFISVLVGCTLILYFWLKIRKNFSKITVSKNDKGKLQVSKSALIQSIQNMCMELANSEKSKIKIYSKRKNLRVQIFLKLAKNEDFFNLSQEIQNEVLDSLANKLGITQNISVDVILKSLKKDESKKIEHSENLHS